MSKKAKLSQLHKELISSEKAEIKSASKQIKPANNLQDQVKAVSSPVRGERGDFLKVTITLPPVMLADLKRLGIERKLQGMRDTDVSSLIREALRNFLDSDQPQ